MKSVLKNAREAKGFKTREVASLLKIDPALISKFESGNRTPTKDQLLRLANLLEIDAEELEILWLKEKLLQQLDDNPLALKALKAAEADLCTDEPQPQINPVAIQKLMDEMESLKSILSGKK